MEQNPGPLPGFCFAAIWYNLPAMQDNSRQDEIIGAIRRKVAAGVYEFSRHATRRSIQRGVAPEEIEQAIAGGEIIEDYPDDYYGPSCLILGYTVARRPIHVQCTYATRPLVKIITVYQPDLSEWLENHRVRRSLNGL